MKALIFFMFISSVGFSQQYMISEAYYMKTGDQVEFPYTTVEFRFEKLDLNGEAYTFVEMEVLENGDLVLNYSDKHSKACVFLRGNEILDIIEYPIIGETIVYVIPKESRIFPSESIDALDARLKKWR